MTVSIDGTELVDQPLATLWQISPIGITGGGRVMFAGSAPVRMVFRLVPLASGSVSQLMNAWDNKPHSFVLPHPVTREDTLYSGVYIKSIDVAIGHMSNNELSSSFSVTLTNVRFNG